MTEAVGERTDEGADKGASDVADPEDAAELVMQLAVAVRETTAPLFVDLEDNPEIWPVLMRKLGNHRLAIEGAFGGEEAGRLDVGDAGGVYLRPSAGEGRSDGSTGAPGRPAREAGRDVEERADRG